MTTWEDVRVGDIVKIMDNESIPADVMICATSEEENMAFVETKNLDGETNLKSRNAVPQLTHLRFFMLGATRVINYKVVEFLRDEGSHIPKALRVLEMKK